MPSLIVKGCPCCHSDDVRDKIGEIMAKTEFGYLVKPINPPVTGAYLIVTRPHVSDDRELPDNWQRNRQALLAAIPWINQRARSSVTDNGEYAGQVFPHVCEWIIPRTDELSNSAAYRTSAAMLIEWANQAAEYADELDQHGLV